MSSAPSTTSSAVTAPQPTEGEPTMTETGPAVATAIGDHAAIWLRRAQIAELAELMENLSVSLRLACRRGSDEAAVVHIKQMRLVLLEAITTAKSANLDGGVRD